MSNSYPRHLVVQAQVFPFVLESSSSRTAWSSASCLPAYLSVVSIVVLLGHVILHLHSERKLKEKNVESMDSLSEFDQSHVEAHGGLAVFMSEVLRTLGCLTLWCLSLTTDLSGDGGSKPVAWAITSSFVSCYSLQVHFDGYAEALYTRSTRLYYQHLWSSIHDRPWFRITSQFFWQLPGVSSSCEASVLSSHIRNVP